MSAPKPVDPAELDDDALLALLRPVVAAIAPTPTRVIADALAAYTWRTIDAELAELTFDSAVAATGTRGPDRAARELTFRAGVLEIELLLSGRTGAELEGQMIPPVVDVIELASLRSAETAAVDDLGRFRFGRLPAGPVCLRVRRPEGWVHTPWTVLRSA